jgi:hypothetical protein
MFGVYSLLNILVNTAFKQINFDKQKEVNW